MQCRQVESHHLTSGEASFLEGIQMFFGIGKRGRNRRATPREKGAALYLDSGSGNGERSNHQAD